MDLYSSVRPHYYMLQKQPVTIRCLFKKNNVENGLCIFLQNCSVMRNLNRIRIQCEQKSNRSNSMQIFIYCKTTLHVSGVTAPIIRRIINCTRSLRYRAYYLYRYSPPTWSARDWFVRVACDSHKPVPEAAGTVFNTPDDGCRDIRNM